MTQEIEVPLEFYFPNFSYFYFLLDLRNLQEQVKKSKIIVALGERFNVFLTSKASISKFVVVQ